MARGYVGILAIGLRFPEAGSLKDKRQYLRSTKAQLQNRFGASVAETGFHDVWQRAQLVIALAAAEAGALEHLMDGVERFLFSQAYESTLVERSIVAPATSKSLIQLTTRRLGAITAPDQLEELAISSRTCSSVGGFTQPGVVVQTSEASALAKRTVSSSLQS